MITWSRFRYLKSPRLALAAVLAGSVVVAAQPSTAAAAPSCASLSACYDNVGISLDSNPAMADFDHHGNSFSDEALTAAGAARGTAIISSGMRFTFPDVPTGASDNAVASGQSIDLSGAADKLGFLMSASNGSTTGTGTIIYTDGSAQSYTLSSPDWLSSTPPSGGAVAVSTDRRNGPETSYPTSIFSQTVALTPGKSLASVTLPPGGPLEPSSPALHIFDISSVTTGNAVTVTNPGNQRSVAGTPVNLQIQAVDSAPGQTLTYRASGLPTGLSINSGTGLISGTPTTVATSAVTVTATDTAGATGSAAFSWAVAAPTCRVIYSQYQYYPPLAGALFYKANIWITNIGDTAIPGHWKLGFAFNEERTIVRSYPDGYPVSPRKGKNMTVTESKGIDIAPRSTVHFAIYTYAANTSSFAPPNTFTLNGATCLDNIT